MELRQLGQDGPMVPVICFGAWPIGGGMGRVDTKQAISTVHAAISEGITFIDTAELYNESESILGKALKGYREKIFLATKVSGDDHSESHIRSAVDNSLKALNTDYLDLYQLHGPQPKWPIDATMSILTKLKDEGKIKYIGISNFSTNETREAVEYGNITSSQPRYNLIFPNEQDVINFCGNNGIGIIAHSVLAKGLLGGKYKPGHQFAKDDERRLFNFFRGDLFVQITNVTNTLNQWAKDQGRDIAQLAIAWVLANSQVTSAIVGMKTPHQVIQIAPAAQWNLSKSDLKEIRNIIGDLQPEWEKDQT